MTDLDFCKLEVTIIHSLQSFSSVVDKFNNLNQIAKYFQNNNGNTLGSYTMTSPSQYGWGINNNATANMVIQLMFTNEQLNCELKIVDSVEDNSDTFVFKVWNFPPNTVLLKEDYLLFKYYWTSDPTKYTIYHGLVKSIKPSRDSANILLTIKGQLVNQNILYNWSIYEKYPKLTYYSDIKDFVENELNFQFVSMVTGFNDKTKLPTPILTRDKSVGDILETVCEQVTKNVLKDDTCSWKFVNGHTVLLYKGSDLGGRILNEYFKITVPSLLYNDLLEYFINDDGSYSIQVYGIPTLVSGIVFYIDTTLAPEDTNVESAYYIAEDVEHNITLSDGYIVKINCKLAE